MSRLKPNSMFSRLMVLFVVVILVSMGFLSIFFVTTFRNQKINSRLDQLKNQAFEIAGLVEQRYSYQLKVGNALFFSNSNTVSYQLIDNILKNKIQSIANEYDAYVIVDKTIYFLNQAPEIDIAHFSSIISKVRSGEIISTKLQAKEHPLGTMFVVAVPWRDSKLEVKGAVIIHTSAQVLEATYKPLLTRILAISVIAFLLSIVFAYIFTKEMTRPLYSMVMASRSMAIGDFKQKAEEEGSEEIIQLAKSFNSMAQQLEQLENSRREFVANVSHELRSPITSLHGFIQGILDNTIPKQDHYKYLQIVSDEAKRLNKLVNELLFLSRMEQGYSVINKTAFDINELIRRVLLRRYNDIEQKEINMEINFEEESTYVLADADAIERVLVNLLDNAIKFTPEGGNIFVGTRKNEKVTIWIEDDGQVILDQDIQHIFDRFYKADKAHTPGQGTGLGLSISKRIIDDHKERIWAKSTEQMTGFYFTLEATKKSS